MIMMRMSPQGPRSGADEMLKGRTTLRPAAHRRPRGRPPLVRAQRSGPAAAANEGRVAPSLGPDAAPAAASDWADGGRPRCCLLPPTLLPQVQQWHRLHHCLCLPRCRRSPILLRRHSLPHRAQMLTKRLEQQQQRQRRTPPHRRPAAELVAHDNYPSALQSQRLRGPLPLC